MCRYIGGIFFFPCSSMDTLYSMEDQMDVGGKKPVFVTFVFVFFFCNVASSFDLFLEGHCIEM